MALRNIVKFEQFNQAKGPNGPVASLANTVTYCCWIGTDFEQIPDPRE